MTTFNDTDIQVRADTAANWSSNNPTLAADEIALEQDTRRIKFGDGSTAWNSLPYATSPKVALQYAISDETTALTTGTAKLTVRMPFALVVTEVRASVNTAPVGSTAVFDINEGGVSILSTAISIDAGEKTSTTAATAPVISDSALADDAEITFDIDQVGSSTAGAGAKITIIGYLA